MVEIAKEPPAPEPAKAPKIKEDRKKLTNTLTLAALVAALAVAGFLYWQYNQKKQQLLKKTAEVMSLEEKQTACKDKPATKTGSGTDDLPIVVFSPDGLFTTSEKTELTNKMINPYKAWHTDQGDSVVSIHVQQNTSISANQYDVNAIYRGAVYEGFLYGAIDAASQGWWTPTCLDACAFSASFRATYPEVVAASER